MISLNNAVGWSVRLLLSTTKVEDPDPAIESSDKEVEEGRRQLRVDPFQQLQGWPKGHTSTGCLRRLDNEEQLVGLILITLRPITGSVTDHGGKQESVADGWAAMCVNPTLKRNPNEGCWVVFRPFPISRDGNIQLHESFGQHHGQAVIGNQPVNQRGSIEWWY
jgi:hypothetical protein